MRIRRSFWDTRVSPARWCRFQGARYRRRKARQERAERWFARQFVLGMLAGCGMRVRRT